MHVNHYDRAQFAAFIRGYGFEVTLIEDLRSGGQPELVIGHPHHWNFVLAERI